MERKRFGIGVVAVVEDGGAGDLEDLAALVARRQRRQGGGGGIHIHSRLARDRQACHRVVGIVRAQELKCQVTLATGTAITNLQAILVFGHDEDLRIGAGAGTEVDRLAREVAPELRDVEIVAIEESDAAARKRGNQFELGARDAALPVGKVLHVRRAHVGDHAPVGSGDARQGRDFAGMIHAHFDYREFVFRLEAQKLQRQAISVVQIALGLEDVELRAERSGDGFLGGSFSGRAGNGDNALAPLAADVRGERLQRQKRIVGDKQRHGERGIGNVATRARETTAAMAPRSAAAATKSWPSKRSPRTAKNNSPGAMVRESME